jgi:hypothetical protein
LTSAPNLPSSIPSIMSKDLTAVDLQSILKFTTSLAHKAGELILEGSKAIQSVSDIGEKKNSVDLVTEFDVRVEELVKAEIGKAYPEFKLLVRSSRMRELMAEHLPVASERNRTLQDRVRH